MSVSENDPVVRCLESHARDHPGVERVLNWYRPGIEAVPMALDFVHTLDETQGELVARITTPDATALIRGHPTDPFERVVIPDDDVAPFRGAVSKIDVQDAISRHRDELELIAYDEVRETFESTPERSPIEWRAGP